MNYKMIAIDQLEWCWMICSIVIGALFSTSFCLQLYVRTKPVSKIELILIMVKYEHL